jgi:hypothetical protein
MPTLAYFGIESSAVTVAIDLLIVFGVLLYLALIYWTYVDARRRILDPMLVGCAAAVSLFPFVGTLLYVVVRPPETLEDARERELDVETTRLRLHQLESSLCPHCDYPIEADYVRCPSCLRKLKERCKKCSRPLDRAWTICPFCETEVPARASGARRGAGRRGSRSRSAQRELPSGELAGELASSHGDGDGREAAARAEPAAAQRKRGSRSLEEQEAAVSGSPPRSSGSGRDGRDADGHRRDRDVPEPATTPRTRAGERSRPAGTPRPGSAY